MNNNYTYKVYNLSNGMKFIGESDYLSVIKLIEDQYIINNKLKTNIQFGIFKLNDFTNKYELIY